MAENLGYAALANRQYKDPTTVGWAQQLQDNLTALVALLNGYKQNIIARYTDDSTVSIETGSIMIAGKLRQNITTSTVTWANTGGNTIAETSSTGYYIWAYASGPTSTFEVAINQTAASMTGNANARIIGWFWNDTGNTIEGVMYFDENNRKKYESKILYITAAGNYFVFNHILYTKRINLNMLFSQSADMTGSMMCTNYLNVSQGFTIGGISDTKFDIRVENTNAFQVTLTGGAGDLDVNSGYVKIFINEQ